jgi:hypothetical protein
VPDYIAKTDIPVAPGVLAYTRGQVVAADAVKANGWEDYVVGAGTKEAREIKAEVTGRPVEDFETRAAPATTSSRGTAAKNPSEQEG